MNCFWNLVVSCLRIKVLFSVLIFTLFIVNIVVINHDAGASSSLDHKPKDQLLIQVAAEPVNYDPMMVEDGIGFRLMSLTMRGLYKYDRNSLLQVDVPHQWQVLWPSASIKIALTNNENEKVYWSDGELLKAKHFQWTFQRALSENSLAPLSSFFRPANLGTTIDIRVLDDQTFILQFEKLKFKSRSAFVEFSQYLKHLLTLPLALPSRFESGNIINVSNGPYHLVERSEKEGILFELNQKAPSKITDQRMLPTKIRWIVVRDENAALNLLRTKKLDILTRLPQTWRPEASIHLKQWPYDASVYIGFNINRAATRDRGIRKNIADALSNEDFSIFSKHEADRAHHWGDRALLSLSSASIAKQAKISVGENNRSDQMVLTYCTDGGSRNRTIAERVQYVLLSKLGWQVVIKERDWRSHVAALKSDQCDLFRYGWLDPMPTSFARFIPFTSDSHHNHTRWRNPEYDDLVSQLKLVFRNKIQTRKGRDSEPNIVKRLDELLIREDAVIVPLFHYRQAYLMSDHVVRNYPHLMYNRLGSLFFF